MVDTTAKQYVRDGLDLRNMKRKECIREGALERYEQDMIQQLNVHCRDKKKETQAEAQRRARAESRLAAQQKEQEREEKGTMALKRYARACVGILLLVGFTNFPGWAAAALAMGLAEFPVIYIYRLYCPLGR